MALAIVGTLFHHEIVRYDFIAAGLDPRHRRRLPAGDVRPHDRDAPADRHQPHVRRAGGHPGGHRRVPRARGASSPAATMAALGFEVLFGALTVTGSLMAFRKLQELITGRPVTYPGQNAVNITLLVGAAILMFVGLIVRPEAPPIFYGMIVARPGHRGVHGPAHRRRGHAGGGLAPQLLRRAGLRGHRLRHREQRPHHLRRAGRGLGLPALDPDEPRR